MSTRPEVISELQSLFKEGATPSRLIRHIVDRHEGELNFHSLIQAYFLDAFGVPIVRGLNPLDQYDHGDLRYSFLNEHLVHEMIQRATEWAPSGGVAARGAGSWLDSLTATDAKQRIKEVQSQIPPDLRRCWSQLTPEEQYYIQMSTASANGLFETVKILSRLAECLQQKIVELESASTTSG
jgi:hypothetical protein